MMLDGEGKKGMVGGQRITDIQKQVRFLGKNCARDRKYVTESTKGTDMKLVN